MRLTDRQIGLLTVLLFVALGIWITGMMIKKSQETTHRIWVEFSELGSLQPEDPVTSMGFQVGKIGTVTWLGRRARVELLMDQPMVIHEGTIFRDENFSLMGQRRVEILPNYHGAILPTDHVFQGVFEPGIAEVLHNVVEVRRQVMAIQDVVLLLCRGDSANPSLPHLLGTSLDRSEQLISQLERTLAVAQPRLVGSLDQIGALTDQTVRVTQQADSILQIKTQEGNEKIAQVSQLVGKMQSSVDRVALFLQDIQSKSIYAEMLQKRELIDQLQKYLETLQTSLTALRGNGGFNIVDEHGKTRGLIGISNLNLFGKTARERAAVHHDSSGH
ncbi:MAG TPA: MlaD family protein [Fibrobacteraceae bacterium]|nr:MlaD family protein [Fibrobacteraceae bacterium]